MKIIENYKKEIEELKERSNIDIVWNNNLDKISDLSHIKLILCADNPGLYEFQDKVYLSPNGKCGTMAKKFFKRLNLDLHEEVIVLNKTPVHTCKTKMLKEIPQNIFDKSQIIMANFVIELLKACHKQNQDTELWILGASNANFGEKNPLFAQYKEIIAKAKNDEELWRKIFCFYHFSCGGFYRELYSYIEKRDGFEEQMLKNVLHNIGTYRKNLFF